LTLEEIELETLKEANLKDCPTPLGQYEIPLFVTKVIRLFSMSSKIVPKLELWLNFGLFCLAR
jgi:hypothetical protein